MLTNEQIGDALRKLSGTLRDGEKGFSEAAENAKDSSLKSMFSELSSQRASMAAQLEPMVTQYGETPREGGSVGAALHRTWLNVRDAITGRDDAAVVAEAERGEDVAKGNYEEVLKEELPADVRSMVEAQYAQVKASHDKVRDLKHSLEAAKS
ncbi:PA2169 family four-helix-bundle protein [Deinococcus sp. KNUC1210]|uniref:PA2169 family four-helix-bundle protein n=1 Tax=Deinococcus sp. KNUC1210 TaxID=2917691 RepID=UPI001EF10D67|nr:PA2169 family four-helix-bundle protein [Deinococcus sp. KNUC1210]ULH15754.1 PA2169 family four-helix-bundle protein [Deinococcus sp. KNUC1210]